MSLDAIGMGGGSGVSDSSGHPGHDPKRRRVFRVVLVGFAVLLVVALLWLVAAPAIQRAYLRRAIPREAAAARPAAVAGVDDALAPTRAPIDALVGSAPMHTSLDSLCWLDHGEGVLASSYGYRCALVVLDFYQTPPGADLAPQTGPPGDPAYGLTYPETIAEATGHPPRTDVSEVLYLTDGAASTADVADAWLLTQELPAYAADDAFATREDVGDPPLELDPQRHYVVTRHLVPYFDTEIGCGIGMPFYCVPPM